MNPKEKLRKAEKLTERHPTEKQKETGRYKKGRVTLNKLSISIENPKGSIRSGVDEDGKEWRTKMLFPYGYFNKTIGRDGDPIDVFIGPEIENEFDVYIVDQVDPVLREFDEHKVMFGFKDIKSAQKAYKDSYTSSWKGFGSITQLSLNKFTEWIKNPQSVRYPARKLRERSKIDFANIVNKESRVKLIHLCDEVIEGETLAYLKKQAGNIDLIDTLVVEIASPGGSVSEGMEIMLWLEKLSNQNKKIVTVVTANAYSICSLIMLAADIKLISQHATVMVHNPMVPEIQFANANQLEKYIKDLRLLEKEMYRLYRIFTGLDEEIIRKLMDAESYLNPEEAVKYGFADEIVNMNERPYVEAVNPRKDVSMSRIINGMNKVIALVNKSNFVNQFYYTTDGGQVEISQTDSSTYKIGDKIKAEDGELTLSDGAVITVKDGEIEDINREAPVVTPEIQEGELVVEPVIEEAKAEGFNEGPAPEEILTEEKAVAEEVEVAEEGTIEETVAEEAPIETTEETVAEEGTIEETVVEEPVIEEQPLVEAIVEETVVEEPVVEEPVAEEPVIPAAPAEKVFVPGSEKELKVAEDEKKALIKTVDGLKSVISELKEKVATLSSGMISNKETLSGIQASMVKTNESTEAFEEITLEAIQTLAENTQSTFKPEAKAIIKAPETGSIFQRAQARRLSNLQASRKV